MIDETPPQETLDLQPGATWHRHPNGGGWVSHTATVDGDAYVGPVAVVYGTANLLGEASAIYRARVCGRARVVGRAVVSGDAVVRGRAFVGEYAVVRNHALVHGRCVIDGRAQVNDNAIVGGLARLTGSVVAEGSQVVSYGRHGDNGETSILIDAPMWAAEGFDRATAIRWQRAGFKPEDRANLRASGIDI